MDLDVGAIDHRARTHSRSTQNTIYWYGFFEYICGLALWKRAAGRQNCSEYEYEYNNRNAETCNYYYLGNTGGEHIDNHETEEPRIKKKTIWIFVYIFGLPREGDQFKCNIRHRMYGPTDNAYNTNTYSTQIGEQRLISFFIIIIIIILPAATSMVFHHIMYSI